MSYPHPIPMDLKRKIQIPQTQILAGSIMFIHTTL